MTKTTTTRKTISIDNVEARFLLFTTSGPDTHRYVVSADGYPTWKQLDSDRRWPQLNTMQVEYFEEDSSGKWFAFANVDCMSPPVAIIRARTFEDAYEAFCDEFERWLKIDDSDLVDYAVDTDFPTCSFNSSGTPIDTEAVTGFEVRLVAVECA